MSLGPRFLNETIGALQPLFRLSHRYPAHNKMADTQWSDAADAKYKVIFVTLHNI